MLLIQIPRVVQSFIKIESNSMLRISLSSPVLNRMPVRTKSSKKDDIQNIEKRIDRISSHCMYSEGREQRAYYKILEELEKEKSSMKEKKRGK